jgi:tRNA A37 methylthiotransferase MiaB
MNSHIFIGDLTHTQRGLSSPTFPLGAACVVSYSRKILGGEFDIKLFKFPEDISKAILNENNLLVLGLSYYSWNAELSYTLSKWAKDLNPNLIIVFGGPNFPNERKEKIKFFKEHPIVDFYIQNEGEEAFVELIKGLKNYDFNVSKFKSNKETVVNCNYLIDEELKEGPIKRIYNINDIPSPYLTGLFDDYFINNTLIPIIETTRGCPFSCLYCSDGVESKSKITRYNKERIEKELLYISNHIKKIDVLMIVDLNFGMFREDEDTADFIAKLQEENNWPLVIAASTGKNQPERIKRISKVLNGALIVIISKQSIDRDVLRNINRTNISTATDKDIIEFNRSIDPDILIATEFILNLPGDTLEKHFECLRNGVEEGLDLIKIFQAILLPGALMSSEEIRKKYKFETRFRVMPGCIGLYKFGDKTYPIVELDEIIIASKDMTFDEYLSCRIMDFMVEIYFNHSLFKEMFSALNKMGISTFDFLTYIYNNQDILTLELKEILKRFVEETQDLFVSREQAEEYVYKNIQKYLSGEKGVNELMHYKGLAYHKMDDLIGVMKIVFRSLLKDRFPEDYIDELSKFELYKNKDFYIINLPIEEQFHYDFEKLDMRRLDNPIEYEFYHSTDQKEFIRNSMEFYDKSSGGFGRFLQRSNIKKMYRKYRRLHG